MKAVKPVVQSVDEGNYFARVIRLVYMGTVEGEYKGVANEAFKINITWELPTETKVWKEGESPKPVVVSKMYTMSMGKKSSLRPIVEGIFGGMTDPEAYDFDFDDLLNKTCLLNVTYGVSETGKEKQIVSTSKLIKGMADVPCVNTQYILSYGNWSEEIFLSLPDFIRKEMEGTFEYQTMRGTYKTKVTPIETTGYTGQVQPQVEDYDDGVAGDVDAIPF